MAGEEEEEEDGTKPFTDDRVNKKIRLTRRQFDIF